MNIKIIAVGKLKNSYIKEGVDDFVRRLSKYVNLSIVEIKDEKTKECLSERELEVITMKEGARILPHLNDKSFVCALDIKGKNLSTDEFAALINRKKLEGTKEFVFVIGGSVGLCGNVVDKARFVLSFSHMTFPHGLMRLILLEQIYRAEKIINGEPYHK